MSKVKRWLCFFFFRLILFKFYSLRTVLSHNIIYKWTLCFHRHQLEKSLLVDPWNTVKEADLGMTHISSEPLISFSCIDSRANSCHCFQWSSWWTWQTDGCAAGLTLRFSNAWPNTQRSQQSWSSIRYSLFTGCTIVSIIHTIRNSQFGHLSAQHVQLSCPAQGERIISPDNLRKILMKDQAANMFIKHYNNFLNTTG